MHIYLKDIDDFVLSAKHKKEEKIYKQIILDFLESNKEKKFKGTDLMLNLSIPEQGLYKSLKDLVNQDEIKKENHRYFVKNE
ncbi:hypothetical protein LCGC14_2199620 [marine sediment metagenome]|uniref:ArnR1-like winged helix-turn-helix domain-containing protein n=1 Tax=marine sediment metagenome TaxID=412755 RepID=A0A0F9DHB1_9ZZZZ